MFIKRNICLVTRVSLVSLVWYWPIHNNLSVVFISLYNPKTKLIYFNLQINDKKNNKKIVEYMKDLINSLMHSTMIFITFLAIFLQNKINKFIYLTLKC